MRWSKRRRLTAPVHGRRCGRSRFRWRATALLSSSSSISSPPGANSCCARHSPTTRRRAPCLSCWQAPRAVSVNGRGPLLPPSMFLSWHPASSPSALRRSSSSKGLPKEWLRADQCDDAGPPIPPFAFFASVRVCISPQNSVAAKAMKARMTMHRKTILIVGMDYLLFGDRCHTASEWRGTVSRLK